MGWPADQYGARSAQEAIKTGGTYLAEDAETLISVPEIDVVIDATGHPASGIHHALLAIAHGHHIIMVNVEADALAGPLLARRAASAGVLFSQAYGDQLALIAELVDWARKLACIGPRSLRTITGRCRVEALVLCACLRKIMGKGDLSPNISELKYPLDRIATTTAALPPVHSPQAVGNLEHPGLPPVRVPFFVLRRYEFVFRLPKRVDAVAVLCDVKRTMEGRDGITTFDACHGVRHTRLIRRGSRGLSVR